MPRGSGSSYPTMNLREMVVGVVGVVVLVVEIVVVEVVKMVLVEGKEWGRVVGW